jgi:hypothetical protein
MKINLYKETKNIILTTMFGMKKKGNDKELPDLQPTTQPQIGMRDFNRPILPAIDASDTDSEEIHGLPSFPDSPMKQGFSQSIIKNAINTEETEMDSMKEWSPDAVIDTPNSDSKMIEMDEWKPSPMPKMPKEIIPPAPKMPQRLSPNTNRPVFIRMDKFKESRETLTKIAEKLDQMDELLKMLKEVKTKEEQELATWEKDIENIKARINFVNREIFENAY